MWTTNHGLIHIGRFQPRLAWGARGHPEFDQLFLAASFFDTCLLRTDWEIAPGTYSTRLENVTVWQHSGATRQTRSLLIDRKCRRSHPREDVTVSLNSLARIRLCKIRLRWSGAWVACSSIFKSFGRGAEGRRLPDPVLPSQPMRRDFLGAPAEIPLSHGSTDWARAGAWTICISIKEGPGIMKPHVGSEGF